MINDVRYILGTAEPGLISSSGATTNCAAPHRSSRALRIEDLVSAHVLQFVRAEALHLPGCTVGSKQPCLLRQASYGSHGLPQKYESLLTIIGNVTRAKRPTRLTY
jgi:hypothetical protein